MYKVFISIIIYIGICAAYLLLLLLNRRKNESIQLFTELVLLLFIPVAGLIISLILKINQKFVRADDSTRFAHLYPSSDGEESSIQKIDVIKEINIVPIEEALVLNDVKTRRRFLLDLLKNDFKHRMPLLEKAVNNEDSETSHYAATAIVEVKRKLLLSLQELAKRYEANKQDIDFLSLYANQVKQYYNSGFLDQKTIFKYKELYGALLTNLIEIDQSDETIFIEKINSDLELEQYVEARRYCDLFRQAFPNHEQVYLMLMKLYYKQKNFNELQKVLDQVKISPIQFTNSTLNIIRFLSKGV